MNVDEIEKAHRSGIRGIFYLYDRKRLAKSLPFKLSLSIAIIAMLIVVVNYDNNIISLIKSISETNVDVLPSLLGFTLGGYALIIGFASSGNLKNLTTPAPNEKGSVFQLLVAIFSINILQQFFAFILSFFISISLEFDYGVAVYKNIPSLIHIVNIVALFAMIFLTLWALFTIPYVVTNLFNLAQINHAIGTVERIAEEDDEENFNPSTNDANDGNYTG